MDAALAASGRSGAWSLERQALHRCGADDGRGDTWLVKKPCERHARQAGSTLFGDVLRFDELLEARSEAD